MDLATTREHIEYEYPKMVPSVESSHMGIIPCVAHSAANIHIFIVNCDLNSMTALIILKVLISSDSSLAIVFFH